MIRFASLARRRRLPRRAFGPALPVGVVPGALFGPRGSRPAGAAASPLSVALLGSRAGGRAARGPRRLGSFPRPGLGGWSPGPARPARPAPRRR
jgi:hypothetical protein